MFIVCNVLERNTAKISIFIRSFLFPPRFPVPFPHFPHSAKLLPTEDASHAFTAPVHLSMPGFIAFTLAVPPLSAATLQEDLFKRFHPIYRLKRQIHTVKIINFTQIKVNNIHNRLTSNTLSRLYFLRSGMIAPNESLYTESLYFFDSQPEKR